MKRPSLSGRAVPRRHGPSCSYMDTEARFAQESSSPCNRSSWQLNVAQRVSAIVYLELAQNDPLRTTLGTVLGTVREVGRKACCEAFRAAICGPILLVRRAVSCRFCRKGACRAIRTVSRYPMCRARGTAVGTATCEGTAEVVCGWISDATFAAIAELTLYRAKRGQSLGVAQGPAK